MKNRGSSGPFILSCLWSSWYFIFINILTSGLFIIFVAEAEPRVWHIRLACLIFFLHWVGSLCDFLDLLWSHCGIAPELNYFLSSYWQSCKRLWFSAGINFIVMCGIQTEHPLPTCLLRNYFRLFQVLASVLMCTENLWGVGVDARSQPSGFVSHGSYPWSKLLLQVKSNWMVSDFLLWFQVSVPGVSHWNPGVKDVQRVYIWHLPQVTWNRLPGSSLHPIV